MGRQITTFTLGEIRDFQDEQIEQLLLLGLRRVIATFRVGARRGFRSYFATMGGVHALERPFDGDYDRLRGGEMVLVEGVVERYRFGGQSRGGEEAYVQVRQTDGRSLVVGLPGSELRYGSSTIIAGGGQTELTPPHIIVGDQVQIAALYRTPYHQNDPGAIITTALNSAHLLDASVDRLAEHFAHEGRLADLLDQIGAVEDMALRRKLAGGYIATHLKEENGQVTSTLSAPHRDRIIEAMFGDKYSPMTAVEGPMGLHLSNEGAWALMQAFDKGVLLMPPREFHSFALEVAGGDRPTTSIAAGKTLVDHYFSRNQLMLAEITTLTLHDFYDRYKAARQAEPANEARDEYTKVMLGEVLKSGLGSILDQDAIAERIVELTMEVFDDDSPFTSLRTTLCNAFIDSLARCGRWPEDEPNVLASPALLINLASVPEAIVFESAFSIYQAALPRIVAAISRTNEAGAVELTGGAVHEPFREHLNLIELTQRKMRAATSQDDAQP